MSPSPLAHLSSLLVGARQSTAFLRSPLLFSALPSPRRFANRHVDMPTSAAAMSSAKLPLAPLSSALGLPRPPPSRLPSGKPQPAPATPCTLRPASCLRPTFRQQLLLELAAHLPCTLCFHRVLRRPAEGLGWDSNIDDLVLRCRVPLSAPSCFLTSNIEFCKNFNIVSNLSDSARYCSVVGHGPWRVIRHVHRLLVYTYVRAFLSGVLLSTHAHPAHATPPPSFLALAQHPHIVRVA
ncbi:hypothetical protein B0H16DRAFT_1761097 [Mycena metata]|uniref:Uncharacterized protein n=1 Tax=Mycena metata TaxID=1033252 RepID=A0AAD7IAN5_9AGAR|nr:hypothetical protein B0H16DRAFT_1761097 [Mycena metata]